MIAIGIVKRIVALLIFLSVGSFIILSQQPHKSPKASQVHQSSLKNESSPPSIDCQKLKKEMEKEKSSSLYFSTSKSGLPRKKVKSQLYEEHCLTANSSKK